MRSIAVGVAFFQLLFASELVARAFHLTGTPHGPFETSLVWVFLTVFLGRNLAETADRRGYSRRWGVAAVLSFVGLWVVYALPTRRPRYGPGFPIESVAKQP